MSRARSGLATGGWWSIPAASAAPASPTTFRIRTWWRRARRCPLRDPGTESGRWSVTFRHVPYDNEAMAALARRNGDARTASALATGRVSVLQNKKRPAERRPFVNLKSQPIRPQRRSTAAASPSARRRPDARPSRRP
jgi:hypothetical protein